MGVHTKTVYSSERACHACRHYGTHLRWRTRPGRRALALHVDERALGFAWIHAKDFQCSPPPELRQRADNHAHTLSGMHITRAECQHAKARLRLCVREW